MPGELQNAVVSLVLELTGTRPALTPSWLLRPAQVECGRRFATVRAIYRELTGLELPAAMPPRETRRVDAVLNAGGGAPRILEVDEKQHFNRYRALTLHRYPADVQVAFPISTWIERSEKKTRMEGGGFGVPRPPLFPREEGRHMQRAFRDMLADLLPPEHGWLPTVRIADFEVLPWIYGDEAAAHMRELLDSRLS